MSSESKANKKTMKSNHSSRAGEYGLNADTSSGRFSSALNRLTFSTDYKPLMRTFTRRFDSPTKVNLIIVAKLALDKVINPLFVDK